MYTFLALTLVAFSLGEAPTTLGGVSSYHPPSGLPILAHEATTKATTMIANILSNVPLGLIFMSSSFREFHLCCDENC